MNFNAYIRSIAACGLLAGLVIAYYVNRPALVEGGWVEGSKKKSAQAQMGSRAGSAESIAIARLEREKAELAGELKEALTMLAERDATLATTKESLDELRRPMTTDIMSSALRAELKSGEVVVTGGHLLPDGRRLYAFTRPVIEAGAGGDEVAVSGRILSLDEATGKAVGLENLNTNAANTLQHGEVWGANEEIEVLGKLISVPGVDVQTTPTVRVKPGASGLIEVGDLKLKVTPVAMRGDNLDFEVRMERPQAVATAGVVPEATTDGVVK